MGEPSASDTPRLTFKTKFFYGLGSAAEALGLFSITSYAMLYYNQVLGLRADLAGLAMSASLLLDGPSDLFMGFLSDRTRSRFGRRHLYMYLAPLPIAVSLFAVFNPPSGLGQTGMFCWFLVAVIALRQFMNIFHTPHSALGGELSSHYTERTTIQAYGSFSTSVGAAAQSWIALSFFFVATPQYHQGLLNPAPWHDYAFTMATLVFVFLYASSWYTRDRIPFLPRPPATIAPFSIGEFFRDVGRAFSNRNYAVLIMGYFCLTMTTGIRSGLSLYTNTFYWGLRSDQVRWIALASLAGALAAFLVTSKLHRRFDKRPVIIVASIIQAISPAIPIWLSFVGIINAKTPGLVPIIVTFTGIGAVGYSVLTISVLSSVADVADQNELRYGVRQEGVMYAMRNMFGKIDQAIGAAMSGFILTWIAFPTKARLADVPHETLLNIARADGIIATLPGLAAIIPYLFYRINRQSHATTKAEILNRRQLERPPGPALG